MFLGAHAERSRAPPDRDFHCCTWRWTPASAQLMESQKGDDAMMLEAYSNPASWLMVFCFGAVCIILFRHVFQIRKLIQET